MFERYTESARRALFFARAEVAELGGEAIETDHLLLGLLRSTPDTGAAVPFIAWQLCVQAGVTDEGVRAEAKNRPTSDRRDPASVEIPFSRAARHVLSHAAQEADRLLHSYIGTEHLLLGLLHGTDHPAAAILTAHGMELETVRNDVVRLLNQRGASWSPGVDDLPGAVSGGASKKGRDIRFERLRDLIDQIGTLVAESPEALALLIELKVELEELEREGPD